MTTTSTNAWQTVLSAAVLGAERARLGSLDDPAVALAESLGGDPVQRLLNAVTTLSVYQRAGMRPKRLAEALAPPAADGLSDCSLRAGRHLACILDGSQPLGLLEQWCHGVAELGWRAPDELLPALLDYAVKGRHSTLARTILKVTGARGTWLASLNPAWRSLVLPDDDPVEVWHTGTREQRHELLRRLRRTQAAQARDLLGSTWDQEEPDERAAMLPLLSEGLDLDDEPFLEKVLDDKRKAVRTVAAELLSRLPGSAFCRRMAERVAPLLTFVPLQRGLLRSKPASLEVTLPSDIDKATARDGIDGKAPSSRLGQKAAALMQMLAATPLDTWKRWNTEPAAIVEAAISHEWCEALLRGWLTAAARQREAAWATALLGALLAHEAAAEWTAQVEAEALLACLSPEQREQLALEALKRNPLLPPSSLATRLIGACDHRWSSTLTQAVLDALRRYFASPESAYDWETRRLVNERLALRMDPKLAGSAADGWPTGNSQHWTDGHAEMVVTLARTLQFRREMLAELNHEQP